MLDSDGLEKLGPLLGGYLIGGIAALTFLSVVGSVYGVVALRSWNRRRRGRCEKCAFPLLECQDQCPECGASKDWYGGVTNEKL